MISILFFQDLNFESPLFDLSHRFAQTDPVCMEPGGRRIAPCVSSQQPYYPEN
jgi:hypothetical protein